MQIGYRTFLGVSKTGEKQILLLLSCIFLCICLSAQPPESSVNYSVAQGLPQSSIYDITQDKQHFIWIGTAGGLSRFDGYQFHTYNMSEKDPKAISSYKEFRFYTDREGRLWIVSFNGISLYNSLTNDFNNLFIYQPRNVVMAENHFFGEDEKFIWIGLCDFGIVKVDKKTLQVHQTPLTRTTHRPGNNVGYHGFIDSDRLWITDNNESDNPVFLIYNTSTQRADTIPMAITDIVNMNDSMALGMDSKYVFLINKKTLAYRKIVVMKDGSYHNSIKIFRRNNTSAVLCSPSHGVFYVGIQPLAINKHIASTDKEGKRPLSARSYFEDKSGNSWIGMRGDGIEKIPYPYKNFRNFQSSETRNNVFGLAADEDYVYAGLWWAKGLHLFSRNGKQDRLVNLSQAAPHLANAVVTITPMDENRMLLVTPDNRNNHPHQLAVYNKKTGITRPLNKEISDFFQLHWGKGNLRNFLYKESKDRFVTNVGEYLVSLRISGTDQFEATELQRFPGETIASGYTHSKGDRWVGTFSGVFREYTGGKWKRVNLPVNKEVKSMCEDSDGNLWLGTNDEIFVVNTVSLQTIAHYTEGKQLVNGHVYAIIRDRFGNMWFSHNKGLSVFRRREKKFEHYNSQDGLQSDEFNVGSAFAAKDGTIFFGGINGVSSFRPEEVMVNRNAPPVNITSIKVFDEPLQTDTAYWRIPELSLPYHRNTVSFEFALPEFTREAGNRYQFMLEGVDEHWIEAGDRRFARYAGLQPNRYVFRVKGANSDGTWSKETSVEVNIVPPFWQRNWFRVLVVLLFLLAAASMGIAVQKWRQRKAFRVLEVQHKIQLERERISRDLHDNVGTQLSLISKHLEEVVGPREQVLGHDAMDNLRNVSQTSKEVIFTLRETIWALNRETISLEEMFDKLKAYTQKLTYAGTGCTLSFDEDENTDTLILGPSEAIHLFRICQEAIANSLKYAKATRLDLECRNDNGMYRLVIADNGIGFDKKTKQSGAHYGLENMQHRCDQIGCLFTIDTAPGKGTVIVIRKK